MTFGLTEPYTLYALPMSASSLEQLDDVFFFFLLSRYVCSKSTMCFKGGVFGKSSLGGTFGVAGGNPSRSYCNLRRNPYVGNYAYHNEKDLELTTSYFHV